MENIQLTNRDFIILREIERWKCCSSRHVRFLAGFTGQRASDRRLKKLLVSEIIDRQKYVYGLPSVYSLAKKGKLLLNLPNKIEKIKIEQIQHDMNVIDVAIYFMLSKNIKLEDIATEKQLHQQDGFGNRKHKPDFIYKQDNKVICVELELTSKAKNRQVQIIKDNFMQYDTQIWVIPKEQRRIFRVLGECENLYPNIETIVLEEVLNYVNEHS